MLVTNVVYTPHLPSTTHKKKNNTPVPLRTVPRPMFSPMTPVKTTNKKSSKKKVDPIIFKQRHEAIEKRIMKLEGKLNKDRALLLRYTMETRDESDV